VLAAPDIGKDKYEKIVAHIGPIANGITLCASSNDKAIAASRLLRDGRVRACDVPNNGPVIVAGVDLIDVSATSTDLFAAYMRSKAINNVIGLLLRNGTHSPPERTPSYEPRQRNGAAYW
jgi:esterase/lipase superfamily enzyme